MAGKITAPGLREMRLRGERIVCLTAYDVAFARLADEAGVDVVLVGDSLGNVVLGYGSTVPVSLDDMVHHTRAVARGVKRALVVADLPFGTYQASTAAGVDAAVALMKAGASCVKFEGCYPELAEACVKGGIPVMGHLGFTPQSVNLFGGHRVQGRGDAADALINEAKDLDRAGVCGMVLELVPAAVAQRVTDAVQTPTIGIGAGAECSGQIQVIHDVLGLTERPFHHAKRYMEAGEMMRSAIAAYAGEVRKGAFPTSEHSF